MFETVAPRPGNTVRLELWATMSGAWIVESTSASPGETGEYRLDLTVSGPPIPESGWPTTFVEAGWLGEPEDDLLASGEFVDVFVFSGHPGDLVEVDVRAEFAPYLALVSPRGDLVRNEDVDGHASRVWARLPEAGEYTIAITSDAPAVTGAYTVKIVVSRPSAETRGRLRAS